MQQPKPRKEMDPRWTWDLSSILEGTAAFDALFEATEKKIAAWSECQGQVEKDPRSAIRGSFEISRRNHVRVATSDAAEQRIVLGNGALRMSAAELEQEVLQAEEQIRNDLQRQNRHLRSDAMRQAFEGREEA